MGSTVPTMESTAQTSTSDEVEGIPAYEPTLPTSVNELLEVQQGTPEEWILYDMTGQGEGAQLIDVHVDADGLYWVQTAGRLHLGSLDGDASSVSL